MLTRSEIEESSVLGNLAKEKTQYKERGQTSYFPATEESLKPCWRAKPDMQQFLLHLKLVDLPWQREEVMRMATDG